MQADGDLEDLEQVLGKKEVHRVFGSGSCSALIKVLPGNKDLYISQVTWTSYAQLLRVFKLYDIGVTVRGSAGECCSRKKKYFRVEQYIVHISHIQYLGYCLHIYDYSPS